MLERARDLLSHALPQRALEEVHLRALRLLVADLEKRKYGAPRRKPSAEPAVPEFTSSEAPSAAAATSEAARPIAPAAETAETEHRPVAGAPARGQRARPTRRRGSAAVRREVRDRDEARCTYVDECGQRCRETRFLELHHLHAHARGGGETPTLRCAAHNGLAAEEDFGREFMRERCRRRRR